MIWLTISVDIPKRAAVSRSTANSMYGLPRTMSGFTVEASTWGICLS